LLECLSNVPDDGLTLSELAGRSGTPVSTASRLVQMLERRGLAHRLPNRRYVPGSALLTLGLRSLRRLPTERYRPAVPPLSQATGQSASAGLVIAHESAPVAPHESRPPPPSVADAG